MFRNLVHTTSHRPPQDTSLQWLQFLKLSNAGLGLHHHGDTRQGISDHPVCRFHLSDFQSSESDS